MIKTQLFIMNHFSKVCFLLKIKHFQKPMLLNTLFCVTTLLLCLMYDMCACTLHQEADLAVAPLTLTAVREQSVDMTTPFMQTGISFVIRKDLVSEESTFSLLSPFSTDMWFGVLIAFLLTGLCIFLVGR